MPSGETAPPAKLTLDVKIQLYLQRLFWCVFEKSTQFVIDNIALQWIESNNQLGDFAWLIYSSTIPSEDLSLQSKIRLCLAT